MRTFKESCKEWKRRRKALFVTSVTRWRPDFTHTHSPTLPFLYSLPVLLYFTATHPFLLSSFCIFAGICGSVFCCVEPVLPKWLLWHRWELLLHLLFAAVFRTLTSPLTLLNSGLNSFKGLTSSKTSQYLFLSWYFLHDKGFLTLHVLSAVFKTNTHPLTCHFLQVYTQAGRV